MVPCPDSGSIQGSAAGSDICQQEGMILPDLCLLSDPPSVHGKILPFHQGAGFVSAVINHRSRWSLILAGTGDHVHTLAQMKVPGLSVLETAVIVETIGGVAVLLDLQKQGPFSDRMDRAGGDVEKVAFMNRELPEQIIPPSFPDHLFQLLAGPGVMSDDDVSILITVQDIPALGFSQTALFVAEGVIVVGMDLDAQVVVGIDDFYQKRKFVSLHAAEQFPMFLPQFSQRLSVIGSSRHGALSVGI